jgi:addiction module HigA family antidote
MSVGDAASRLGITRAHLSRILNGHGGITANMSLRLSAALGTSPDFWLKMQMNHDLWVEQKRSSRFNVLPFPHVAAIKSSMIRSPGRKRTQLARSRAKQRALSAAAGD